jgi:pimeloyl-ACP methyl ester carboxylesterase/DNA-binding winged helix-turn-helix (wHTH) protein
MVYKFNSFEVNQSTYEVLENGKAIKAQPQIIELLIFLLENHQRYVSKEEIHDRVWKDRVVSDTTVSSCIKSIRKLLGDDGKEQKFIRTVHGRGFQFIAELHSQSITSNDLQNAPTKLTLLPLPQTRYAKSGNVHIAYQVFGEGASDIVFVPGFISHIENYWSSKAMAEWLTALGTVARVIMFDKRGTGMSDTVYPLPDISMRMDDVSAVLDAEAIEQAYIMGISEGGSLASLFAASHPTRCLGLILYGAFAQFTSWFKTPEDLQGLFDYIEAAWGSGQSLPAFAPSAKDDTEFMEWWGKFERLGATPGAAIALMTMNSEIDITDILPSIKSPTLVIHRSEDVLIDVDAGRMLGERIPNARYIELDGNDHLPWVGANSATVIEEIKDFVDGSHQAMIPDTTLTTLLSIKVGLANFDTADNQPNSASLLDDAQLAISRITNRYRGQIINPENTLIQSRFDSPAKAVHCACEIVSKLTLFSLNTQVCAHIGEVKIAENRVTGTSVEHVQSMHQHCDDGQVIISETVKALLPGSGLKVVSKGKFKLVTSKDELELYCAKIE